MMPRNSTSVCLVHRNSIEAHLSTRGHWLIPSKRHALVGFGMIVGTTTWKSYWRLRLLSAQRSDQYDGFYDQTTVFPQNSSPQPGFSWISLTPPDSSPSHNDYDVACYLYPPASKCRGCDKRARCGQWRWLCITGRAAMLTQIEKNVAAFPTNQSTICCLII